MRYVVLDTDVASRIIKRQLGALLAARLTAVAWCVTFVTVGELWRWATMRSWGRRSREELEDWLSGVVKLDSDPVISREWGRISADARRRGRPRPANDTWITACCLVHGLPLATLSLKDFEDFAEHDGVGPTLSVPNPQIGGAARRVRWR